MKIVYVVVEPFGDYAKGDIIDDPVKMAEIADSENANHVIRTTQASTPEEG